MAHGARSPLVAALAVVCIAVCKSKLQDASLPFTYPAEPLPNTTSLYFGLLQSFGGTYDGSGSIPGIQLALDNINEAQTLLPGYTLQFVLRDSFCEHTTALESLHRLLFEKQRTMIAMMGSGCSLATEPTAEIDHYYNLTHISCVSSSILLSNRTRYRAYFQMLPSEADISAAIYGAIQAYGWGYLAIITQNENILTLTTAELGEKLQAAGVRYSERMFETKDGISLLNNNGGLFDPRARIFLIATFSSHARDIICVAYKKGYRYPQYMFLTYAWYPPQWWDRETSPDFNCTGEERLEVLNHTLAFLHFPFVRFGDVNASTDVNVTGYEYMEAVQKHVDEPPFNFSLIAGAGFCHDATWTLAYALNRTVMELMNDEDLRQNASIASGLNSSDFSLADFSYQNNVVQQTMLQHLTYTHFTGVTGQVKFHEGIRDVDDLRVLQIQRNSTGGYDWVKIASVIINNENATDVSFIYVSGVSNDTVFPEGIPHDGIPLVEDVTIHLSLTILISLFVAAGLAFSIVCLVFNTLFRQRKLIRLSSPNLNYIICVGAIILYLDMILLVIPSTDRMVVSVLCNLNPWFTSIGYSLCYGTIVVKMFRVYYIYSNPSPRKKNTKLIKDEVLILIVFGMVAVDLIILCIYFGMPNVYCIHT
jgi:gamma-aminobutyric acid type B receptor